MSLLLSCVVIVVIIIVSCVDDVMNLKGKYEYNEC